MNGIENRQINPKMCRKNMLKCNNCTDWEPIPFHDDGGVCMAGSRMPMRGFPKLGLRGQQLSAVPVLID